MEVMRAASAVPAWQHALALKIIFHRTEEPEVARRDDDKDQKKDKDHHDGLLLYFRLATASIRGYPLFEATMRRRTDESR